MSVDPSQEDPGVIPDGIPEGTGTAKGKRRSGRRAREKAAARAGGMVGSGTAVQAAAVAIPPPDGPSMSPSASGVIESEAAPSPQPPAEPRPRDKALVPELPDKVSPFPTSGVPPGGPSASQRSRDSGELLQAILAPAAAENAARSAAPPSLLPMYAAVPPPPAPIGGAPRGAPSARSASGGGGGRPRAPPPQPFFSPPGLPPGDASVQTPPLPLLAQPVVAAPGLVSPAGTALADADDGGERALQEALALLQMGEPTPMPGPAPAPVIEPASVSGVAMHATVAHPRDAAAGSGDQAGPSVAPQQSEAAAANYGGRPGVEGPPSEVEETFTCPISQVRISLSNLHKLLDKLVKFLSPYLAQY